MYIIGFECVPHQKHHIVNELPWALACHKGPINLCWWRCWGRLRFWCTYYIMTVAAYVFCVSLAGIQQSCPKLKSFWDTFLMLNSQGAGWGGVLRWVCGHRVLQAGHGPRDAQPKILFWPQQQHPVPGHPPRSRVRGKIHCFFPAYSCIPWNSLWCKKFKGGRKSWWHLSVAQSELIFRGPSSWGLSTQ